LATEDERRRELSQQLLRRAEQVGGLGTFEVDLRSNRFTWSDEMYRLHGYEPGEVEPTSELILSLVHPDDREAFAADSKRMLESPYHARRRYRIKLDDGEVRHLIGENQIEEDGAGNPVRMFGTVQDITDDVLAERELLAHHELSQALSEWESLDEGMVDLLRRLGTAMEWDAGNLWGPGRTSDELVCHVYWSAEPTGLMEFERTIRALRVPRGTGTMWRAWERQEPIIIEDAATDARVWAKTTMLDAGLRSAIGIPAVHEGETLAVVYFEGREPRRMSDRLMRTLTSLGLELGRFLSRRRTEIGLRKLSARELEVLKLASEGHSAPRIGERLGISPATVKTHFVHAYEKLGVSDRAAAVAEAMRRGLFD
jgi:PAS domain S-box-containing protein